MNSASLELAVYPNNSDQIAGPMEGVNALYASQGWPFYWPSTTLQVPANSLITMTITQYDSGGRCSTRTGPRSTAPPTAP